MIGEAAKTMDFLDPAKKRARNIRLIVGYILIGIAIALVTSILVFQSYGYDLDRKTGAIIQNGLLFVAAQPEAANVYLNDKQYKAQNNAKLVLPSDVYRLKLTREGYRDWNRTFSLAGGTIERMTYPFLFPTKLQTQDRKAYDASVDFATQSPSRQWIVVQQPGKLNDFDLFDANDPKKTNTSFTLPNNLLTASTSNKLELVEWANDNRRFLVKHQFATGHEFIIVDTEQPNQSVNVNKTFNVAPTKVSLRDKKYDHLFFYDQATQTLSYAEVKQPTLKPVASKVLAYKTHGDDTVLYVTDDQATPGKVRVMLKDNDGTYQLREITTSSAGYLLNLAKYDNKWYVAAGAINESIVYVYKDPQNAVKQSTPTSPIPIMVLRADNPDWLEFSANTQFITLRGGQQFAVYDAENDRNYRYKLEQPIEPDTKPAWMDGNRIMVTSQRKMVVLDYDGINTQTLSGNQPGMIPFFDRDYKVLYNIAPVDGGKSSLTQTDLRVTAP